MTEKNSMFKTPVVMTIAGSDSGGGAGIAADIKTFAAFGVHGTCAITSVTAQNTTGVLETFDLAPEAVASQIEAVCTDMDVKWAKTGMLASSEIIKEVAKQVKKHNLSLVLDPVMAAEAGGDLLKKKPFQSLLKNCYLSARLQLQTPQRRAHLQVSLSRPMKMQNLRQEKLQTLGLNPLLLREGISTRLTSFMNLCPAPLHAFRALL